MTLVDWIINIRYCYWHRVDAIAIIQTTMRYADNSVTVCIKIEAFPFFFFNRRAVIRKNSVCANIHRNISISMNRIIYSRANVATSINLRLQWKFKFSEQIGNWFSPRQTGAVTPAKLKPQAIENETSHSELNYSTWAELCFSIYLANLPVYSFTQNVARIAERIIWMFSREEKLLIVRGLSKIRLFWTSIFMIRIHKHIRTVAHTRFSLSLSVIWVKLSIPRGHVANPAS